MINRSSQYISLFFSFFWIVVIFLDYWYYHQSLNYPAIVNFYYFDLLAILAGVGVGLFFLKRQLIKEKGQSLFVNGVSISLLFFLLCILILVLQIPKANLPISFTTSDIFLYIGKVIGIILATYLVSTACFVLGDFIYEKLFSLIFSNLDHLLIRTAIGIICFCIILFLLGAVKVLNQLVVGAVLLALLGGFYKRSWKFIKYSLLHPVKNLQEINGLGIACFLITLTFVALNYLQNITPFPLGFDSLAIYLNLPNLIDQRGGLITGYSPYYWSLFASIGHILFNDLSLVISLSNLGGILSGFCIYTICRKWTNPNYSLLAVALFFSLPMVNFQFYKDVKTDLGLLFFMLVTVLLLVNYIQYLFPNSFPKPNKPLKEKVAKKTKKSRDKKQAPLALKKKNLIEFPIKKNAWFQSKLPIEYQYFILMGLLSGMSLGIKLTGLILIFSLMGAFVYLQTNMIGFLTASILFVFIILAGGLDVASGLRVYHFGATYMMWGTLLLGAAGLFYVWSKQKNSFFRTIRQIGIYGLFTLLIYLPWPIKNMVETGSISFSTLTEGKPIGPSKEVDHFIQNASK